MSDSHLKNVRHSSNLLMKPFIRMVNIGIIAYVGYWLFSEPKYVERVRPNYPEYRKQKGLPDVPLKHPGWFAKENRIVPPEEQQKRKY